MKFTLEREHKVELEKLSRSGMTPILISKRSKMLLRKSEGMSCQAIADELGVSRHTVELWIKKYRNRTPEQTLTELLNVGAGRGRKDEISGEAKTWLIGVACTQPKDLGYSAETWTISTLTKHINKTAKDAGFERLSTVSKSGVYKILNKADIKPFRIQYYCNRRDPEFDSKMHNVLVLYKQVGLQFDKEGNLLPFNDGKVTHVISYDEKPGIQAIANTSADLPPKEGNATIKRDYEYKRLGTLSLLAGIDLHTGEAIPLVKETHNSNDYIDFLKKLDVKYPEEDKIRLVLDNLKVHKSEKVKRYIASLSEGRFEFVFTPVHASWLNLIEGFFSKMTKQMLKGIRVKSKQELKNRIYKYFEEINEEPVVFHWSWNLKDIDPSEAVKVDHLKSIVN